MLRDRNCKVVRFATRRRPTFARECDALIAVFVSEVERAGLATLIEGQRLQYSVQTDRVRKRTYAVRLELL